MRTKKAQSIAQSIQPSAIFTADWHLREDQPECWTDDYFSAQEKAVNFVMELQEKYSCPVVNAGDIFDRWKPSPELLSWANKHMPFGLAIAGQHDLPNHSVDLYKKSGLRTLEAAGCIRVLRDQRVIRYDGYSFLASAFPFGSEIESITGREIERVICICHTLTWHEEKPYPDCTTDNASLMLKKIKGYDVILVGDNHKSFVVKDGNRLLISPGSLMQMTADQVNHQPKVFLYYAETNEVESVLLPVIAKSAISRKHLDRKKEKDEMIESFVKRLKDNVEIGLSFEENLKKYLAKNKVSKSVEKLIWKSLEE